MRTGKFSWGLALCCGLLIAGGCAKEQIVKPEEGIATKTAAPEPPPAPKTVPAPETQAPTPPKSTVKEDAATSAAGADAAAREAMSTETKAVDKATLTLGTIYFDFDSSEISEAARSTLKNGYTLLTKNTGVKVQVEGHCDERGSDEYNLALGDRRAKAAMSYLITLGVRPERLSAISYGKEKPADPGHTEEAWAKNRRAEFVIVK